MKKTVLLYVIIIFILFFTLSANCAASLEIKMSAEKEVLPGTFVTYVVKLINNDEKEQEIKVDIKSPDNWRLLKPPDLLVIKPGKTENLFITLAVPDKEVVGLHKTELLFQIDKQKIKRYFNTWIKPVPGFYVGLKDNEIYLKQEELYTGSLKLINTGNISDTFYINVKKDAAVEILNVPEVIELKPGKEKNIQIQIKIPDAKKKNKYLIRYFVKSKQMKETGTINQNIHLVYDINDFSRRDYLWHVTAKTELNLSAGSNEDTDYIGVLVLDGDYFQDYSINMNLIAANLDENDLVYNIKYKNYNNKSSWVLGDTSISSSPVEGIAGRGIKYSKEINNNKYKIFASLTDDELLGAIIGQMDYMDKTKITGVLVFIEDGSIMGIHSKTMITDDAVFELGLNGSKMADDLWGAALNMKAGLETYKGYMNGKYFYNNLNYGQNDDRHGIKVEGGRNFSKKIYTSGYGEIYKNNLDNEPEKESNLFYNGGIYNSIISNKFPNLYLGVNSGKVVDLNESEIVKYNNRYYLGTTYQLGNLALGVGFDRSNTHYYNDGYQDISKKYIGNLRYRIRDLNSWISYEQKNIDFGVKDDKKIIDTELGLKWKPSHTGLKTWIVHNNQDEFNLKDSFYDKKIQRTEIGIGYKEKRSKWSISTRVAREFKKEKDEKSLDYLLAPNISYHFDRGLYLNVGLSTYYHEDESIDYQYNLGIGTNFGVPVPGIREYSDLNGIAFIDKNKNGYLDQGEKRISNLVLKLNNINAITNKMGNYSFPPLNEGIYILNIDTIIPGLEAAIDLPREIELSRGDIKQLDIPFKEISSISGKVFYDPEQTGKISDNQKGIPRARIIISGQDENYEVFTNQQGKYSIKVKPGEYKVRVDKKTLPKRFSITTSPEIEVEVKAGKNSNINIGAYQEPREIIFTYIKN